MLISLNHEKKLSLLSRIRILSLIHMIILIIYDLFEVLEILISQSTPYLKEYAEEAVFLIFNLLNHFVKSLPLCFGNMSCNLPDKFWIRVVQQKHFKKIDEVEAILFDAARLQKIVVHIY